LDGLVVEVALWGVKGRKESEEDGGMGMGGEGEGEGGGEGWRGPRRMKRRMEKD
jgi:hypothetical protein